MSWIVALAAIQLVMVPEAVGAHGGRHQCFCCAQKRCDLTVSLETEEVGCFEVECKDICIPPVTFPWECRPRKCGRIRTVNVLTTETRERQVCEYKWDVVVICPRCRDALQEAGCELAPGVQVLDQEGVIEAVPVPAAAAEFKWESGGSVSVRAAAPWSFAGERYE